jgi:hypothetical protein
MVSLVMNYIVIELVLLVINYTVDLMICVILLLCVILLQLHDMCVIL